MAIDIVPGYGESIDEEKIEKHGLTLTEVTEMSGETNFKSWVDAKEHLESFNRVLWFSGSASDAAESFPWVSEEVKDSFRNLKTQGEDSHFVLPFTHSDGARFSIVGIENIRGNTIINFINSRSQPESISILGKVSLKTILDAEYEVVFPKNVLVWPDIFDAGCVESHRNLENGTSDGFMCSRENTKFYFQSQNQFR